MQGTMGSKKAQLLAGVVGHGLVVLSVLALAALGQAVPEQTGWVLGDGRHRVVCGLGPVCYAGTGGGPGQRRCVARADV